MTTQAKSTKKILTTFSKTGVKWVNYFSSCYQFSWLLWPMSGVKTCKPKETNNTFWALRVIIISFVITNMSSTCLSFLTNVFHQSRRTSLAGTGFGGTHSSKCHSGNRSFTNSWLSCSVYQTSSSFCSVLFPPPTAPHTLWNMCSSDLTSGNKHGQIY